MSIARDARGRSPRRRRRGRTPAAPFSSVSIERSGLIASEGAGPRVARQVTLSVSRAQALLRLRSELERGGKESPTIPERHHGGGHRHGGCLYKDDNNLIPNREQRRGPGENLS